VALAGFRHKTSAGKAPTPVPARATRGREIQTALNGGKQHESLKIASKEAKEEAGKWEEREKANKGKGNISIAIRRGPGDSSYLSMDDLANLVDKRDPMKEACLARNANEYKPIREAVATVSVAANTSIQGGGFLFP